MTVAESDVVSLDDVARIAARLYRDGPLLTTLMQRHRHWIAPVHRVLSAIPCGSSVLDVGCGGGLILNCAAAIGRIESGLGFDCSRKAIDVANLAANRLSLAGCAAVPRFELRSVEDGMPSGEFDVVMLVDVLHHVPSRAHAAAFYEAASRVTRGGRLILKEMRPEPAWRALMNRAHDLFMAQQWIHYVAQTDADSWASASGLERLSSDQTDMLWYAHALSVYKRPL